MKVTFLDVLDRAHSGPVCKSKEWDMKVIPQTVREMIEKYGLKGSFDPDNPVNMDDALADEFWKAGFEFAEKVGMICLDTERVIKFSEDELKSVLESAPDNIAMGGGVDRRVWRSRYPGDPYPAGASCGPFGTAVTEDVYVETIGAAAQYSTNDVAMLPTPLTFNGRELKDGSPYEIFAGKFEAEKCKEAVRRVDRPNMSVVSHVDATGWGAVGGYGMPGGLIPEQDWVAILAPSCLKTHYYLLNKVAHVLNFGGISFWTPHYSMIGGYSGSPEGCVISTNASAILQLAVHKGVAVGGLIYDLGTYSGSSRGALWASSVSLQAQSRNTHIISQSVANPRGGPCTKMLLYEVAAQALTNVASGAGWMTGISPREGKYTNYCSGLENKLGSELVKRATEVTRKEANEIVKKLLEKYESKLADPDIGVPFQECTDVSTLQPTKEWFDLYTEVKQELIELGLPKNI